MTRLTTDGILYKGLSCSDTSENRSRSRAKRIQVLQKLTGVGTAIGPGEYDGPMFLTPGLVIGSYVSGMSFTREERLEMIRYLVRKAHPVDGGWGL